MSQAVTPTVGSKVGRYALAVESTEALAAPGFIGRAEDGSLARVFLVPRAGTDADAVQRAAAQAKNLSHPHSLRFGDVDSIDGRIAISFEHAEGVSLHALLAAAGASGLTPGVALRIGLDVLEGLSAAHGGGLAHGELGPHLIFVGTDGSARVAGIGVARVLGKALAPKTPSDRLAYIAPERVKAASAGGAPVADAKCDVFSVGVLLWEMFAKQRLFAGRLESAVIQKVLTAPVTPLAATADDVPDGVDEALKKALERDPAKRTATALELAQALEAAFTDGAASHEEVGRVVEELAKKALEEMRSRLTAAGAIKLNGDLNVPPARPSFPTLDDSWVEQVDVPSTLAARAPPPPKPSAMTAPKPAPKPFVKPADAKGGLGTPTPKPVEVKAAIKVEAKVAETAAGEAPEEAKPASGPVVVEAKPETKVPAAAVSAAPARPGAPKAPVPAVAPKAAALATAAAPATAVKRPLVGVPRKGTLLGMAPPTLEERNAALAAARAEEAAKAAKSEQPASKRGEAAESAAKPVEDAASKPADGGTPPHGTPRPAELTASKANAGAQPEATPKPEAIAAAEASSTAKPVSAATPKPPAEIEATPSSSGSGMSLADRKKRTLPGNVKVGDALGRYELLLPVASGGMATVWAARLQGTAGFQKIVAIKTMLPGMSADVDFEEMFLDEARVAARIRHPNVVEIFDLGEEEETLYLVMEWVDGETLGAVQRGSKPHGGIPLPILLRLASQACAGLHAAHELRDDKGSLVDLVHRDISPANILVSRTGFVKIVDFGVAKSKARLYTTRAGGMIKGKTPYLSPEQLAGQPIDRRSDLYSFGAVLYVLATGLHPFRGETEAKTIENIALRDPVPLRKIDPSIHPELEAIVLKALEKDRDKRFDTAGDMQRALDTLAASIGQTTTDDDVAAFVRKVAGEGLEKRGTALRDAIATADVGKKPIEPRQASTPDSAKEAAKAAAAADADAGAAKAAAAADADAGADAAKVDIDDVDIDADDLSSKEPPSKTLGSAGSTGKPAAVASSAAALAASPAPVAVKAEIALTAPSLGSDNAPDSPSADTLAAASTEPEAEPDLAVPRRRTPMLVVGGILGACALIGIIAFAGSGGGKPSASAASTGAVPAATNPESVRTAQPVEPAPSAAPTPTEVAPAPAPAETASAAAVDPTPPTTAETAPSAAAKVAGAATAPGKGSLATNAVAPVKTAPVKTAPVKTAPVKTAPVKTAAPAKTAPTKPIKKFEPTGL